MRFLNIVGVAATVLFGLQVFAAANTWYVDDDNYGKSGLDGVAPETAYGTIQDAITNATTLAGDTILVLPGVYDQGTTRVSNSSGARLSRVLVTKNNLTIRSTKGPEVTHIVGRLGAGVGADGDDVSCVVVAGKSGVLDGFTLRNGCAMGGFDMGAAYYGRSTSDRDDHLVNCVVSNCVGNSAVVYATSAHRCKILFNRGVCARYSKLENCLVGYEDADTTTGNNALRNCTIVNCTVAGALNRSLDQYVDAYNSISALNHVNRPPSSGLGVFYNSLVGDGANVVTTDQWREFVDSAVLTNNQTSVFLAPLFGDFRLVAGSPAIDFGKTEFLSKVPLPEGYAYRDLNGALIDTNTVVCHAGAVQEVVQPAGGLCLFRQNVAGRALFKVNGHKPYASFAGNVANGCYAYPTTWPEQWCVTAISPDTKPLSCVSDSSGYSHFATRDGQVYVIPPKAMSGSKTLKVECATDVFYVDPVNGNDAFDGSCAWADAEPGLRKGPWRTLMQASTNSAVQIAKRIQVRCAPGLYAEGDSGRAASSRARVAVFASTADTSTEKRGLHFVATSATEPTAIVGAADPESTYEVRGCGPSALRCVYNAGTGTGFTGFVLTNGYSNVDVDYECAGGCVYQYNGTLHLADCVITGNGALEGVVAGRTEDSISLSRCLVANNKARLGVFCGKRATLSGCVLMDNAITKANYGWFYDSKTLINCTLYVSEPTASDVVMEGAGKCLYNCIFVNTPNLKNAVACRGSVLDNCTGAMTGFSNDCVRAAAFLARPSAGDFRLCAESAAWQTAVGDFDELANGLDTDYLGRPIVVDGKVRAAGAVMAAAENGLCVSDDENRLLVTGRPSDANDVRPGETVTIAPNTATKRPVIGLLINGVTNLFGTAASLTFPYAEVPAGGALAVRPVATADWYVNPNVDPAKGFVGDDDNHGYSPEFPKRTLKGVASVATVSNDVIHAAAGVYDSETMNAMEATQPSRIEIPSFVTLVSDEGCDKTVIRGASGEDANGFGAGAIRCVAMRQGATLRGFTLTDGHIVSTDTETTARCCGPGVCGYRYDKTDVYVEDCIVSNCVANYCVLLGGTFRRCQIVNNAALKDGILGRGGHYYNVLVARNVIGTGCNSFRNCGFENVTYADDNVNTDGERRKNAVREGMSFVNNSVVFGAMGDGPATNTVFVGGRLDRPRFVNCCLMTEAEVALDANYRPSFGVSKLIDAGTNACCVVENYETWGGCDLAGNPRLSNGVIDIGAYEADWRPQYTRDICRFMCVSEASRGVTESTAKSVLLKAGDKVVLDLLRPEDSRAAAVLAFRVLGGTLAVSSDDGRAWLFAAGNNPQTLRITDVAVKRVVFAAVADAGETASVELLKSNYERGVVVVIR